MFFTFSIGAGGPGTDRRRIRSRFQDEASRVLIPGEETGEGKAMTKNRETALLRNCVSTFFLIKEKLY
jgi:hypothetical protein